MEVMFNKLQTRKNSEIGIWRHCPYGREVPIMVVKSRRTHHDPRAKVLLLSQIHKGWAIGHVTLPSVMTAPNPPRCALNPEVAPWFLIPLSVLQGCSPQVKSHACWHPLELCNFACSKGHRKSLSTRKRLSSAADSWYREAPNPRDPVWPGIPAS